MKNTLGVIGLGTMGANIARNAARNGAKVSVFNRTSEKLDAFLAAHGEEGMFVGCTSLRALCEALPAPRAILLMVSAGDAVDVLIEELLPLLDSGDILIDGGNSHYRDTQRRCERLERSGIRFVGMGISGGEKGALLGPSMMPGGNENAVQEILPLFSSMAADDGEGKPCIAYMGAGGAGHFVKMVHNGIEYGVMQLIAEAYAILKRTGMGSEEIARTFAAWTNGDLASYLMEITGKVLAHKDTDTGDVLVELIKDQAAQKGTGRWTVESALHYGVPIPTITASVEARALSARKDERSQRSKIFPEALLGDAGSIADIDQVRIALEVATLSTYSQGFELLRIAGSAEKWNFPLAEISRIWRGGCIIRSPLLEVIQKAYEGSPSEMKRHKQRILDRFAGLRQQAWRAVAAYAIGQGVAIPAFASSLAYYDSIRSERLPQNLIAAQRDFFGAHGYERLDKPGVFHTQWE